MDKNLLYNGSGVKDYTAAHAIRKADCQPQEVNRLIEIIKNVADLAGYEIEGRIALKNKKTRKVYR
ncbi:hypothetical protein NXH76_11955 [Blautia schinkii]|nr:hypothetical protein [Blautia schinkii]